MSFAPKGAGSACYICKFSEEDDVHYGMVMAKWRIRVHTFCMLLSPKLVPNGKPDVMCGYTLEGIKAEVTRIRTQKCYLCEGPYANLSCCANRCGRTYHIVCGTKACCVNEFAGRFRSWCPQHVELNDSVHHDDDEVCVICDQKIGSYDRFGSMVAPCCRNGWFHRRCGALRAFTAGYYFNCPLCNSDEEFKTDLQLQGVFIPLVRPPVCDAPDCRCPQGRNFTSSVWSRRFCEACGSSCRHDLCHLESHYICKACQPPLASETPPTRTGGDDQAVPGPSGVSSVKKNLQRKSVADQTSDVGNDDGAAEGTVRHGDTEQQILPGASEPALPSIGEGEEPGEGAPARPSTGEGVTKSRRKASKANRSKAVADQLSDVGNDDCAVAGTVNYGDTEQQILPGASEPALPSIGEGEEPGAGAPARPSTGEGVTKSRRKASKENRSKSVADQMSDVGNDDCAAAGTVNYGDTEQQILPGASEPALPSIGESEAGATGGPVKKAKPKRRKSVVVMLPQDEDTRSRDGETDPPANSCTLRVVNEAKKDHIDLFVASVAASLRLLSQEEYYTAKREINEIMYKFELMALARHNE
ncbi:uncharacterized protein LOC120426456 [Culex pipiens pallens]|uniref:uncharacterized protein LOC120426456 n=1 Tax=Culex pipiens pallens TaxID=42434 RepID=UPI001952ABAD|nr:uncharacterized protein LOC120426456 [Culex pipiens pallens]